MKTVIVNLRYFYSSTTKELVTCLKKQTNARCPNCKKKMSLSGEGGGQIFTCMCGYREKLSAFKKRRDQSGSGKADPD